MVTKEQAMTCKNFLQVSRLTGKEKINYNGFGTIFVPDGGSVSLVNPIRWRVNGKCKTWKRNPERFKLPIKHGLYSYGYITEENAHLFIVEERDSSHAKI